MTELKYQKYIMTDLITSEETQQIDEKIKYAERATRILWLDDKTLAIGRGYRTNDEGIIQLKKILTRRKKKLHHSMIIWIQMKENY